MLEERSPMVMSTSMRTPARMAAPMSGNPTSVSNSDPMSAGRMNVATVNPVQMNPNMPVAASLANLPSFDRATAARLAPISVVIRNPWMSMRRATS